MANNGELSSRVVLPYGSWKTVRVFLGKLKNVTIPPRIDSSVMVGMSGSGKSEMRVALRYLGLIDAADAVTPKLKELLSAHGTDNWGEVLGDMVLAAYRSVIGGESDWLDNGTATQLREKFHDASAMDGGALDRAIRFFLNALDDAGVTYSPYFKAHGARAASARGSTPKTRRKRVERHGEEPRADRHSTPPPIEGTTQLPFAIPGKVAASVMIPTDLTLDEWVMIDGYVRMWVGLQK